MDDLRSYLLVNNRPNLTIVVNRNVEKLFKVADSLRKEQALLCISVNIEISKRLIGKSTEDYSREIIDWLSKLIKKAQEKNVLITDIEIFFESSFGLDPLTIFKQVSRNSSLIVMWPGEYKNNILSYASPEHAHYRTWANPGVEIIQV